ncbi:hypothetical protein ElyMa_005709600 [Elysia marginata]|uniref:Uncharacterized protein n=1 Tax=Elysia marginata TaxID=1093978 RepID=A0AAV4FH62_9GAST|nr:hypothetical protein ElyMa_005709600 [Elysia marginata]
MPIVFTLKHFRHLTNAVDKALRETGQRQAKMPSLILPWDMALGVSVFTGFRTSFDFAHGTTMSCWSSRELSAHAMRHAKLREHLDQRTSTVVQPGSRTWMLTKRRICSTQPQDSVFAPAPAVNQ